MKRISYFNFFRSFIFKSHPKESAQQQNRNPLGFLIPTSHLETNPLAQPKISSTDPCDSFIFFLCLTNWGITLLKKMPSSFLLFMCKLCANNIWFVKLRTSCTRELPFALENYPYYSVHSLMYYSVHSLMLFRYTQWDFHPYYYSLCWSYHCSLKVCLSRAESANATLKSTK